MRYFLAIVLSLTLGFGDSFAGCPGGGGGGRSYSSGGRSFSSGGSRPSYSSGRSTYSSGGSKPAASRTTTTHTTTTTRPTYTSGRSTYTSGPSVKTAPRPSAPSNYHPGTSYTSGNSTFTAVSATSGTKPKGGAFDGNAAAAQHRAESKANYIRGPEPRTTYTTPTGNQAKINTNSRSVETIHNMDHHTYITRETRVYTFYHSYPYYSNFGLYPVVVYNDPFSSFFWYWMLDQSLERRAMWAYNHRSEMDDARYQALLAKDAKLEGRIRQLETEKHPVDPTYVPPGLEQPDLQYTDDYVDAVYNPHTEQRHGTTFGKVLWWFFIIVVSVVGVWFVIYLLFVKKWSFK